MSVQAVLLPLFVEVVLTFVLLLCMVGTNRGALERGDVRWQNIALREPDWPPRNRQFQNAYLNQFELPVLFYVLTILSMITHHADLIFVILAWIFVAMRLAQAFVHVTDNHVPRRGAFFFVGAVVLAIMWGIFIVRILLGLP